MPKRGRAEEIVLDDDDDGSATADDGDSGDDEDDEDWDKRDERSAVKSGGGPSSRPREAVRNHLRKAIQQAQRLAKTCKVLDPAGFEEMKVPLVNDPEDLAAQIEEALHCQLEGRPYTEQARALAHNLQDRKNSRFRYKLFSGFWRMSSLPRLTAEDMASDLKTAKRAKIRKEAAEARDLDWDLKRGNLHVSGSFTCGKCKGTQTQVRQLQTRSCDEPMTTFVTCITCKNRWKFSA